MIDFALHSPEVAFILIWTPLFVLAGIADHWLAKRRRDRALYADSERQQRAVRRWRDRA